MFDKQYILNVIKNRDKTGIFIGERAIIGKTVYAHKHKIFDFFPNYSTTYGPYNVTLQWDFDSIDPLNQAGCLIHEATHQAQRMKDGQFLFTVKYLARMISGQGYINNAYEVEARERENIWRKMVGLPPYLGTPIA